MTELVAHPGPEWVVAEMPAGYQTRLSEIQRLMADLQEMGRFARLLWDVGPPLGEAARDAFTALKFDAQVQDTSPVRRRRAARRQAPPPAHPIRNDRGDPEEGPGAHAGVPDAAGSWPRNPIAWSS